MATKRKPTELLKQYYEDLESLTPEECARLHQYASDQKKEMEAIVKVMGDMLLNVYARDFPKIINLRTASITEGSSRAPKAITWAEIAENELPITEDVFKDCAHLNVPLLRELYPAKAAKLERTEWFQSNKTTTAAYIKWSEPIRKISK